MMSASRTYPVHCDAAFDAILPAPLERIFPRRYGPIPAVRDTEGAPEGAWGQVGYVRAVLMADGGTVREELTRVDRPNAFGYTLSDVTGPMRVLAARVEGLWTFTSVEDGTSVTWQWIVHSASALAAPLVPVFALFWRRFAMQSLKNIENVLSTE
jgi:hypothetical protein